MRCQRKFAMPISAVVAVVMLVSAWAQAQVLQQVPPDALAVIKVNNLQQVSGRIGKLAQQWGVAGFQPDLADPLAAMKVKTGIQNGLSADGELAIAMLKPGEGEDEPTPLVLIPVTDYAAFTANFAGATTDAGITTFRFAGEMTDSFSSQWGNYAAVSNKRDAVATKPEQAVTIPGAVTQRLLGEQDIVVWANMPALSAMALPEVQGAREGILAEVDAKVMEDADTAKYAPAARELVSRCLDVAEGFLQTTDSGLWGVRLSSEGIGLTWMAEFHPESYAANLVGGLRPAGAADGSLLNGIPEGQYLFVAGGAMLGSAVGDAMEDFIGPVRAKMEGTGEAGDTVQSYIDAMLKQVRASNGSSAGMLRPTGPLGQGGTGIFRLVSVNHGDAQAMLDSYKQMMEVQQELMEVVAAAMPEESAAAMSNMKTTITENAKTVDGVSFDKIATTFAGDPNDAQAAQVQQMMAMMYGPEGQAMYVGKVDESKMVLVMGGDEALMSAAVKAAKAGTDPLAGSAAVQGVAGQLPKGQMMVGYVMVGDLVSTVLGYAQQFGMPVNVQLPEGLPPVGMSLSGEGAALRTDVFIPSQLVQSMVAAAMQVMMQMQGGQQPGGPEGL
jgi:hypothetical protein